MPRTRAACAQQRHSCCAPETAASLRTDCRRLAAALDTNECPRAALYIIPALPNVKDAAVFQLVRATYIDTLKRLAPAGVWAGWRVVASAARGLCGPRTMRAYE